MLAERWPRLPKVLLRGIPRLLAEGGRVDVYSLRLIDMAREPGERIAERLPLIRCRGHFDFARFVFFLAAFRPLRLPPLASPDVKGDCAQRDCARRRSM